MLLQKAGRLELDLSVEKGWLLEDGGGVWKSWKI